jgi:hypothetical protein
MFLEKMEESGIEVVPLNEKGICGFMYDQGGGFRCKTSLLPCAYQSVFSDIMGLEEKKQQSMREEEKKQSEKKEEKVQDDFSRLRERLTQLGLWYEKISESTVRTIIRQKKQEALIQMLRENKGESAMDKNSMMLDLTED